MDLERPGGSFWSVDPLVGFGIAFEEPGLRVPFKRSVEPVGDTAKLADGYRSCADFDVCGRSSACSDAIDPISDVS